VDERDAGPLYVTHFTLLLGLAAPVWLAARLPCGARGGGSGGGSGDEGPWWAPAVAGPGAAACPGALAAVLAGLSGTVIIGFGDTAASVVGRALGRVPVHAGARKTAEGTAAGAAAAAAGWAAVLAAGAPAAARAAAPGWAGALAAATAGACQLEAVTSQLDNILIPLWYFPHALLAVPPAR
jgi:dolichol kinase